MWIFTTPGGFYKNHQLLFSLIFNSMVRGNFTSCLEATVKIQNFQVKKKIKVQTGSHLKHYEKLQYCLALNRLFQVLISKQLVIYRICNIFH